MSTEWPSQYVINTSQNWVEHVPRPSEQDTHPAVLEQRQIIWDRANERNQKLVKRTAQIQAEREAEIEATRKAEAEQAEERREKQRAAIEEPLYRTFLANGGSVAEWEKERDGILAERRKNNTLMGEDAARADQRAALLGSF